MKYKFTVEEFDVLGNWVRSVNAYASKKRAETACERLETEAHFSGNCKRYEVWERD